MPTNGMHIGMHNAYSIMQKSLAKLNNCMLASWQYVAEVLFLSSMTLHPPPPQPMTDMDVGVLPPLKVDTYV